MGLALDIGFGGLALGVERVELLLEPMLGGFAGVDRAAQGRAGVSRDASRPAAGGGHHGSGQAGGRAAASPPCGHARTAGTFLLPQPEEARSIPVRAGDQPGDLGEAR